MKTPSKVYSAPGKALLAGGYLVLFPEYSALSIGLSSRMYSAVFPEKCDELLISSPQFDSEWSFPSQRGTHPNPFLAACYEVAKAYFGSDIQGRIVIWSDSGFHSQENIKDSIFAPNLRQFSYHGKPITEVPKTGLGSSAALVVVVTAALARLAYENGLITEELTQDQLHNLSQIAHCSAQKKVGSGFDVATAVYGSIMYSRFRPEVIPAEIEHEALLQAVNSSWEMRKISCDLPNHISVLMGDVSQGSETPGMVKQVLNWKKENPKEAQQLFTDLNAANMELAAAVEARHFLPERIQQAIKDVRKNLQKLTKLSGVPIEPARQTALLDKVSLIEHVLGGVVPGAGGDDAICVLVDTSSQPLESTVQKLSEIEGVSWMQLSLETKGLASEDAEKFTM